MNDFEHIKEVLMTRVVMFDTRNDSYHQVHHRDTFVRKESPVRKKSMSICKGGEIVDGQCRNCRTMAIKQGMILTIKSKKLHRPKYRNQFIRFR